MGALIFLAIIFISCGSSLPADINHIENEIFDDDMDQRIMHLPTDNKLAIDENNDLENHLKDNAGHRLNNDAEEIPVISVHWSPPVQLTFDAKPLNASNTEGEDLPFKLSLRESVGRFYGGFQNNTIRGIFIYRSHQINARAATSCKYPTNLKDSELDCTIFPSRVVCIHTCMFGYTLETGRDGIRRTMECKFEENKWRPVAEFEKCKPFIDCGVTIGPGGAYKCHKNFMNKGTECDISCSHYEDKEAVPEANYQCDINGNWTPELPFCAKAGSGLKLVRAPSGPKTLEELKI